MKIYLASLYALLGCGLLVGINGCKTGTVSNVKDDLAPHGAPGAVDCAFTSPLGSGEKIEIWATASSGAQLDQISQQYTPAAGAPNDTRQLGSAPNVPIATLTANNTQKLRAYAKSLVYIDPNLYRCYGIIGDAGGVTGGYLCLASAANDAGQWGAYWITDLGHTRYVLSPTVYRTACRAQ